MYPNTNVSALFKEHIPILRVHVFAVRRSMHVCSLQLVHMLMCPTTTRQALRCVKKKKRKEQGLWTRQIAQEMRCVALYLFFM